MHRIGKYLTKLAPILRFRSGHCARVGGGTGQSRDGHVHAQPELRLDRVLADLQRLLDEARVDARVPRLLQRRVEIPQVDARQAASF